jgi:hypothetical protein
VRPSATKGLRVDDGPVGGSHMFACGTVSAEYEPIRNPAHAPAGSVLVWLLAFLLPLALVVVVIHRKEPFRYGGHIAGQSK